MMVANENDQKASPRLIGYLGWIQFEVSEPPSQHRGTRLRSLCLGPGEHLSLVEQLSNPTFHLGVS